jgi:hypothetical protein
MKGNSSSIKKFGFNALVNQKGFRKDGSMHYGDQINQLLSDDPSFYDYNFKDTYARIADGNRLFEYGTTVSTTAIETLDSLLNYCKQNQVFVVGFIPPYADAIAEKMSSSNNYTYQNELGSQINPVFEKYAFEFWELQDLSLYQSDDREVLDGYHGGELSYLKMLMYMLEHKSKLNTYTNLSRLKSDLKNKVNRYMVYDFKT